MLNREVFQKDPASRKLVNEGVAYVNDISLEVLRYELETFVCDGQYEKGLEHILKTYISNLQKTQQPGVWVSGFFGSGKSHLIKILRALWLDTNFTDGATARGITNLPDSIKNELKVLTSEAKRHGYLHAAAGRLDSGASGSVRLALLGIIFKSVGLPEQYSKANFVMWLKEEKIYEEIKKYIIEKKLDWDNEIDKFQVSTELHSALKKVKPDLFAQTADMIGYFLKFYPPAKDVTSEEMIRAIKRALTKEDKFPLTLVALDEVQQFIGEDGQRSLDVQEVVEACCKQIGAKLLFIATGQTAVTGTANLKKLEGRFTIRIELSDADVDAVIRKVILAKMPNSIDQIEAVMQKNMGEISRHLTGTSISHRPEDNDCFAKDYPILPSRRRFWEQTLRVLDRTGVENQLRNQMTMIHKAVQTNLDLSVGYVIPADYLYFDIADRMLQARILPQKIYRETMKWRDGTEEQKVMARACGLVFLINKLASVNKEVGIRATIDSIADLLVENISEGSSALRNKLPGLLSSCELLMKVGDEFKIQTEESTAWNDEFLSQKSDLGNNATRIEGERDDRIRKKMGEVLRKLSASQGKSKVPRDASPIFDTTLPKDFDKRIYIWIRDGWNTDEKSVQAEARAQGTSSPTVFVFIPKRSADDLRHQLIDYKAAFATLDKRGSPVSPEGIEARAAMETIKQGAESKIKELIDELFSGARVYQAGGNELVGSDLSESINDGVKNSLERLYSSFDIADHEDWGKVYEKAKKGAADALKLVGFEGESKTNPVCKKILEYIAAGKKGTDIREFFDNAPYGWSGDAIDGAIQVLLVSGHIKALDERGEPVESKDLERKNIGKTTFKLESTIITVQQRLGIRGLYQELGISCPANNEQALAQDFIQRLTDLARSAGGDAPCPERPSELIINNLKNCSGNEQLLAIFNYKENLTSLIKEWKTLSSKIEERIEEWNVLSQLEANAKELAESEPLFAQIEQVKSGRLLLRDPNPLIDLERNLAQVLRKELNELRSAYEKKYQDGLELLKKDACWGQLEKEQQSSLLRSVHLDESSCPQIEVKSTEDILKTLDLLPLAVFKERILSMPGKFDSLIASAAKILEPKTQSITVSRRTLKTDDDVNKWIDETKRQISEAIKKGPVTIQ